jgi:hypothetical protein
MTLLVRLECPLDGPNGPESRPGFDAEFQVISQGSETTSKRRQRTYDEVRRETCEKQD